MNANAKIELVPYTNSGEVVGIRAILHDGGVSAIIADVPRDYISSEPLEQVFARAMTEAIRWLKSGPVALRATCGDYVART